MSHEPSRVVGNLKSAVQLVSADTLLARRHQMIGQNPLGQRNVAALHDLSGAHRELAATVRAMEEASAVLLAASAHDVEGTTVRAPRTPLPTALFKPLAGGVLVMELGIGKVDVHGAMPRSMRQLCRKRPVLSSE